MNFYYSLDWLKPAIYNTEDKMCACGEGNLKGIQNETYFLDFIFSLHANLLLLHCGIGNLFGM